VQLVAPEPGDYYNQWMALSWTLVIDSPGAPILAGFRVRRRSAGRPRRWPA
jgi:hypothetical protein